MKAQSQPGNYGSVGGAGLVLSELLKHEAGFDAVQVNYRSVAASLNDMQSGSLDFMFLDPTTAMAQVKEGRIRALAVTTPTRSAALPDLPTLTELGYPRIDRVSWLAALLPAQTPRPIIKQWSEWLGAVLSEEDTKAYFRKFYMESNPGTPEAMRKLQQDEIAKWADLVKLAKIEPQ
jgi:tripartite-type tricarboxylate transporter receptor subunit TctC